MPRDIQKMAFAVLIFSEGFTPNQLSIPLNKLPWTPPSFRDAIKRLLTNKLFMYNFGSSLFFVLAFMGFGTFMPKYFEHQFQQKRSSSSYRSIIMVVPKAIGFLISGFVVSR